MAKVYIVASGEYSSYHIDAIFSKKELAEEYCRRAGRDYEIEDWELDEPLPDAYIRTEMSRIGEVFATEREIDSHAGLQVFYHTKLGQPWDDHMIWCIKTDDEQVAIKAVNEKRFQILALDIWGDTLKVRQMVKQE